MSPTAQTLEKAHGHPGDMWEELKERVQSEAIDRFASVEDDWLALMWSLDQFKAANIPPARMGKLTLKDGSRLDSVYRSRGNWFSTLLALILQNMTTEQIRPRTQVRGYSQLHQIDLAWPSREVDPLICAEAKVAGNPGRGALADFTNRRKELKFASTDLKLYRRDQREQIDHWGAWREKASPKFYLLWAARLKTGPRGDKPAKMVEELQALVNTYLEGAGVFVWKERADGSGYERVSLPGMTQVTDLDDVLHRIATEIRQSKDRLAGATPPPVLDPTPIVDVTKLREDPETFA